MRETRRHLPWVSWRLPNLVTPDVEAKSVMRKMMVLLGCLALAMPAHALLRGRGYLSIEDLLATENLLIAKADAQHAVQVLYNRDQVRTYSVVCLKVLNGSIAREGQVLAVDSEYPLADGQRYLLAGGKATLGDKPWPLFTDKNSAIRLPDGLKLASLEGKDKRTQILMIIEARLGELEALAKSIEQEQKSLRGLIGSKAPEPSQPAQPEK
jgi:hypothetical protein